VELPGIMRQFELHIEKSPDHSAEILTIEAPAVESVFFWAAYNAVGRTVEIFEDGLSRGCISIDAESGYWRVSGPSENATRKQVAAPRLA
jgi:hypothetical protein